MWGTGNPPVSFDGPWRFIPTHVGNGHSLMIHPRVLLVHPHACGERNCGRWTKKTRRGSSPRMWGTGKWSLPIFDPIRFIPTHVGNGGVGSFQPAVVAVHPHACGERLANPAKHLLITGSSPRMWGTGNKNRTQSQTIRFIPTHVGNGRGSVVDTPPSSVHPHACGERTSPNPMLY